MFGKDIGTFDDNAERPIDDKLNVLASVNGVRATNPSMRFELPARIFLVVIAVAGMMLGVVKLFNDVGLLGVFASVSI
jgi:hypothetical protein